MKKFKWLAFILGLIATLTLVACSNDSSEGETSENGLKKVTIQIDGAAVPYYAPLYLAKEKGYFEEQGLDVEFLYAAASDIVKNVGSGNVQFGFPNGDSVISARAQDIPVSVVHTTYQNGLGATIFKNDSGIQTPADLKDKTIAVTSYGSPNYIQLQVLLEENGLSLRDVEVKVVGTGSIVNALVADEVDAITFSMLRTVELQNQGVDVSEFRSDEFLPSHGNVLIVGDKFLESDKETVSGFVKALNSALEYIVEDEAHVVEAVDLSVEKYAPSFEDKKDVAVEILNEVFVPYLWQSDLTKEKGFGTADLEKWQNTIEVLTRFGIIDEEIKAEDFVIEKIE